MSSSIKVQPAGARAAGRYIFWRLASVRQRCRTCALRVLAAARTGWHRCGRSVSTAHCCRCTGASSGDWRMAPERCLPPAAATTYRCRWLQRHKQGRQAGHTSQTRQTAQIGQAASQRLSFARSSQAEPSWRGPGFRRRRGSVCGSVDQYTDLHSRRHTPALSNISVIFNKGAAGGCSSGGPLYFLAAGER